jgi:hypothetical protein
MIMSSVRMLKIKKIGKISGKRFRNQDVRDGSGSRLWRDRQGLKDHCSRITLKDHAQGSRSRITLKVYAQVHRSTITLLNHAQG